MPRQIAAKTEMLSLRIDAKLKRAVAALAKKERRSVTAQTEILLEDALQRFVAISKSKPRK